MRVKRYALKAVPVSPDGSEAGDDPGQQGNPASSSDWSSLPDRRDSGAPAQPNQDPSAPPAAVPVEPAAAPAPRAPDVNAPDMWASLPDQKTRLEQAYGNVAQIDPERAARVGKLARNTGEDPGFIAAHLDPIEKAQAGPPTSLFQTIEDQYPGTAKFLSQPTHMAAVHDDISNLAQTEHLLQSAEASQGVVAAVKGIPSQIGRGIEEGYQGSSLGYYLRQKLPDLTLPENAPALERYTAMLAGFVSDIPAMAAGGILGAGAGATALGAAGTAVPGIGNIAGMGAGAIGGGAMGAFAAPAVYKKFAREEIEQGPLVSEGNPLPRLRGLLTEATKQGAVGLGTLLGAGAPGALGAQLAERGLIEAGGKAATALAGPAAHVAGELAGMTGTQAAVEGKMPSGSDVLDNVLLMATLHGAGKLTGTGIQAYLEMKQTQAAREHYMALGDTVEASKLRERDPDLHQAYLAQVADGGPVENVYVPREALETYFQSKGKDPAAVMEDLGAADSFRESAETGNPVEIPLSSWATRLRHEDFQAFADDVKFDPEGLSANEQRSRQADTEAATRAAAEALDAQARTEAQQQTAESAADSAARVRQGIEDQMRAIGMPEAEIKSNAAMHQAVVTEMARKLGLDPEAFQSRYQLSIDRKTPEQVKLADRQQFDPDVLSRMKGEIEAGSLEQGGLTKDQEGYVTGRFGRHSTFPEYFKNKGYTKKGALLALDRALDDPATLTDKQHAMLTDLYNSSGHAAPSEVAARADEPFLQGEGDARGRMQIKTQGSDRTFHIDLLKAANESTLPHELAHYYLEVMRDVAGRDDAPALVKEDFQKLLDKWGLKSGDEIQTDHHEDFARMWEQYLGEGKAPVPELQGVFDRFRRWITSVYRQLKNLNVDLTPEVRGVFDRLLASEDAIANAREESGLAPGTPAEAPPEAGERIRTLEERARDQAEATLLREQMKELRAEHQEFLGRERKRAVDEATEEAKGLPLYTAIEELNGESGKQDAVRRANAILESGRTDAAFEAKAEVHGFGSGEELARAISGAAKDGSFQKEVQARVAARMAKFADLKDSGALRVEALKAVHSERMTELLALERQTYQDLARKREVGEETTRRNRLEARVAADAARSQAREILSKKAVSEAGQASRYITAERNAAVRAAKALARKDYEAASEAKRQQMLNHALASEAMRNAEEIGKAQRFLSKFEKRGNDLLGMSYGFNRQIDGLLVRFGIGEPRPESPSLAAIAQDMAARGENPNEIAQETGLVQGARGTFEPESLKDFVARMNDSYYSLTLPESVLSSGARAPGEMTLSELRDLKGSVQVISTIGKKFNRFLSEFIQLDMRAAARQLRESMAKNFGTPYLKELAPGSAYETKLAEQLSTLSRFPGAISRTLDTILTTCHKFDGLKEGPAKEFIYRPMADAEGRKLARMAQVMEEQEAIFAKHYTPDEFSQYKDKRYTIDGRTWTKEQALCMALNSGNEGNLSRLTRMMGSREALDRVLNAALGKKDWDFAQATWDHIDRYWPEISKLQMDVDGVEPGKVEALPFQNIHGSYQGGYYPIAYDFEKSSDAFRHALDKDALFKQFSTARAATDQGHTEARVAFVKRPLRLSLDVLRAHHEDVIHDLEFRRPVVDAARFLNERDVKAALTEAVGVKGYSAVTDWLKAVAGGSSEPLSGMDKAARWFRFKTTFFNLGFRLVSAPKIAAENLVNVASELGVSGAARAVKSYYLGDTATHEQVIEKSQFMRMRSNHLDRDISDINKKWQGTKDEGPLGFRRYAFFVHAYLDQGMTFPLWADTYSRQFGVHGDERLAVHQADEAVKRTFMSGGAIDQAGVMRGGEKQKLLTTAYGYHSMMWQRFSMSTFAAKQEWAQGNYMAAASIAARAGVYQFFLPGLVAATNAYFLRNAMTSSPEDDRKRFTSRMIEESTPLKFIPVLRDVAPYMIKRTMGEHISELHSTPLDEAAMTLINPVADSARAAFGGHVDPKLLEHATNSVSLLTGYPKQLNDAVFNFVDWIENNGEASWRDAISRRTKK